MNNRTILQTAAMISAALLSGLAAGYFLFSTSKIDVSSEILSEPNSSKEEIWTCSMHPQIRQPNPGLCPLCDMDLILLEENESGSPVQFVMNSEALRLAEIQTRKVSSSKSDPASLLLSGVIQADERRSSAEVVHFPGRIEQLHTKLVGERIRKGQRIATIFSPELITAQRELQESLKFQDTYPELADAAREKLRSWKISESEIKAFENSEEIKQQFPVFAGKSGTLAHLHIAEGDYVKSGQRLYTLNDLDRVWIVMDAYPDDIPLAKEGDSLIVSGPSLQSTQLKGVVTFIDPTVNPVSGVGKIRAEVRNAEGMLKPGMLVTGKLQVEPSSSDEILSIPASSVLWTGQRSVVYIRVPESQPPVFEYREVTLGEKTGNAYRVLSGLKGGEEVVVNGAFRIDAAAQLSNRKSMMNAMIEVNGESAAAAVWADDLPETFKDRLRQTIDAYLQLKDALVQTNSEKATVAAEQFLQNLEEVPTTMLTGQALLYWSGKNDALRLHASRLKQASDIESQRTQFEWISNLLIDVVRTMQFNTGTLFVQHCPMAFNDQGADWLSDESQILNPYFGDVMLRCGIVKDTLLKHLVKH